MQESHHLLLQTCDPNSLVVPTVGSALLFSAVQLNQSLPLWILNTFVFDNLMLAQSPQQGSSPASGREDPLSFFVIFRRFEGHSLHSVLLERRPPPFNPPLLPIILTKHYSQLSPNFLEKVADRSDKLVKKTFSNAIWEA